MLRYTAVCYFRLIFGGNNTAYSRQLPWYAHIRSDVKERGDSIDNVMAADVSDVVLLLHDICIVEYKKTAVSLLRTP